MDDLINLLTTDNVFFLSLITIIGLMVGSFLNVIRTRLPVTLNNIWRTECYEFLELSDKEKDLISNNKVSKSTYNNDITLLNPRSHCPHCKKIIAWWDNIPLLSFIILGGKCRHCKIAISLHYPLLELTTAVCSFIVAYRFGFSWQTGFGLIFTWVLIVQSWIDLEHKFLPDGITLSCLWFGLIASCVPIFADSLSAITGACLGYLSLWSIYWVFKLVTGKEGMGYGDFKLLAMLGACLGWQHLPLIILLSSSCGAVVGISLITLKKKRYSSKIPFGPYLAAAGWISLLYGEEISNWYLNAGIV